MIRSLKNLVKRLLSRFGLIIFKRSTGIYIGEEETPGLAVQLCGVAKPIVIDGGAHKGSFVDAIRLRCSGAKFICFEPDPFLARELRARFDDDRSVTVVQAALGAQIGKAWLNINKNRATNSLESAGETTGVLHDFMTTVERTEVSLTTIDAALAALNQPACDIIKLDLQGHDLAALRGAHSALQSAKAVIVEVWFAPVYARSSNYLEICELLRDHGFEVYALIGQHYSDHNRLLWCDGIFVKSDSAAFSQPLTI